MWDRNSIDELITKQREYFLTNETLSISFRIEMLKKLKAAVIKFTPNILEALKLDLGRSETEAYFCDVGDVILEINEYIKGLRRWAKPKTKFSGFACFPSLTTKIYRMPYGNSLIISPFNFPFLLSLGVLAASIAGGNTSVIKASSKSVNSTNVLIDLIHDTFDSKYVEAIDGGHDVADMLLETRFDKIFYTGSPAVGKHVMEYASRNLTPVALELGGETGNWCVIRKDANLKDAARKIAFFKACNSGQICININQVAVASEVAEDFIKELKSAFISQLGPNPVENEEYAKMIGSKAYNALKDELESYRDKIYYGGYGNDETLKFSPTILYPIDINDPIVNHELFNPILPIVKFDDDKIDDLMKVIATREHGLALYLFTKNIKWAKKTMRSQQYGGGCINEVCLHLMVKGAPFNGTGHSGMGAYHGKYGFDEFTHPSTVLFGKTYFNLSLREHPYNKKKLKMLKAFLK